MGSDLALVFGAPSGWWEEGDFGITGTPSRRDLALVSDIAAADQMLIHRLKTQKGELAALGHPEYGSRHHELLGEPNVERTRRLIKMHVLEALQHEPRIEKILACDVTAPHQPPRDVVRIVLQIKLISEDTPRNLVVPFSLESSA